MSFFLGALLALSVLPLHASEGETVRLVIRGGVERQLDSYGIEATPLSRQSSSGWIAIEVPVTGTVENTIESISLATGSEVRLEQRYDLFAPGDEPSFPQQWYLENTGQTGGTPDADIDTTLAWDVGTGTGVVVAVVDSGVDLTHPELAGRIDSNKWDFVDDDPDPSPVGTSFNEAHGTAVAGIIAAAVNGAGITGVAPGAKLMAVRACSGGGCWSDDVADAVRFAVDRGADVINLSLGSITSADDPLIDNAMAYAESHGVMVVAAAGNEHIDLDHMGGGQVLVPGGLPHDNIITVGSTDDRDQRSSFSNYGSETVDIGAPGSDIVTLGLSGGYVEVDGTSFSAPIVSGVAALLLSLDPGIGHQEVIARIESFSDHPSGIGDLFAAGRVNAGGTLTRRFVDTSGSTFEDAVDWLAAENITQGCNPPYNQRFCPKDAVTRGAMAVFLSRAFGLPPTGADFFDDDDGRYYEAAANRLAAAGLTVGCGPRRYCGEASIRRDEMAAMLARGLGLPVSTTNHFVDDNGSIFEKAIDKIAAAGITLGCNPPTNNRYCPSDPVSRGQMAAFIKRSVELSG